MSHCKVNSFSRLLLAFVLLSCFTLACKQKPYNVSEFEYSYHLIDSLVGEDDEVELYIKPYRDSLAAEMNTVIGKARQTLNGGLPEGLLLNFVSDLTLSEANKVDPNLKADFSVINLKGLRVPIEAGEITVENIYQLMPFENELVFLTLQKKDVEILFNYMASVGGDGLGGASFTIKEDKAVDIRIGGKVLEDRDYVVVTSDYLADGGDHFTMFSIAVARSGSGLKVRDAIINHIKNCTASGQMLDSKLDNRITYAE